MSWLKTRGSLGKYDSIINTGFWQMLVVELLINSIQPLPFIWDITFEEGVSDWETTVHYRVNDVLLMLMCLIRIYLAIRCILTLSFFMGTRSQ